MGGHDLSETGQFILSTLSQESSLGLAMAGMILQSFGLGMFNAPNNSSILSAVERHRYGAIAGFLNLVRNSANVTSIALATAIVTATMASKGYPPSLASVSIGEGPGLLGAFAAGVRIAYLTMGSLALGGIVASFLKGEQLVEAVPRSVEEPDVWRETSV